MVFNDFSNSIMIGTKEKIDFNGQYNQFCIFDLIQVANGLA